MTFIYLRIKKSDGNKLKKQKWGCINVKRSGRISLKCVVCGLPVVESAMR